MSASSFFVCSLLLAFVIGLISSNSLDNELSNSCSEDVCGSRVSWCVLSNSCNCSMTPHDLKLNNCTCCKDCFQCLGELFPDCCACVGLCRPTESTSTSASQRSSVAVLKPAEDQVSLFEMITTDPLPSDSKWTVKTYPAFDISFYDEFNISTHKVDGAPTLFGLNCTVAFMKQCLSLDKCDKVCTSMGASWYRWFHTGCCECVGRTCINFGWLEGLCQECRDTNQGTEENTIDRRRIDGELWGYQHDGGKRSNLYQSAIMHIMMKNVIFLYIVTSFQFTKRFSYFSSAFSYWCLYVWK